MTPAEYSALAHPRLSHPARSLYTLQLRRLVLENQLARLNYPELGRALAVVDPGDPSGFSFQVNARQLTELFDELMEAGLLQVCLLYTSPSPRDRQKSRMPSSA